MLTVLGRERKEIPLDGYSLEPKRKQKKTIDEKRQKIQQNKKQ
jgi:hypothetical protein